MRLRRSDYGKMRKILLARHDLAGLLDPVLAERALQPVHDRTFDAQPGIAPVILVLRMPGPLLGQTKSADVADAAVDDRFLAMVAIIEPSKIRERGPMKAHQLHAGIEHQLPQLFVHFVSA